jgi:hypothetical protein
LLSSRIVTIDIGVLSQLRTLREYDCKADKVRGVSISDHDGAMATGHAIHSSDEPGKWVAIPPSTVISILSKVICAD